MQLRMAKQPSTLHCDSDTPGRRRRSLYRVAYRIRDRGDSLDGDAFATGEAMDVAMWDEDRCEPEFRCFSDTLVYLHSGAYFASQPDFPDGNDAGIGRYVTEAGDNGNRDGKIDGRIVDANAAGDIDENIASPKPHSHSFLQDRKEHLESLIVESCGGALRHPVA